MSTAVLDSTPDDFARRLFVGTLGRKPLDKFALRGLMTAIRLFSLLLGQRHRGLLLQEQLDLLGARLDKLPPRQRPHYTPIRRFRILQHMRLVGMSEAEAAERFRISVGTISAWQACANPDSSTVGSLVKPTPPVRRYNDIVQHLAQLMAGFGFSGYGAIARHLARAGWRVARTTVRRYVKASQLPGPTSPGPETPKWALVARYPHHVWHLDLTELPAFLGSAPRMLAVLLDSAERPNSTDMLAFVERAIARFGRPRHLIVDEDGCFTATAFEARIAAWRVSLRFCSAENHRANAKLERFWARSRTPCSDSIRPLSC